MASPLKVNLCFLSQLLLPSGVTVEVIVVNIVSAGHLFVQQHTHPTYHALRSLDQQMFLCYSQPETPTLPSPAEGKRPPRRDVHGWMSFEPVLCVCVCV